MNHENNRDVLFVIEARAKQARARQQEIMLVFLKEMKFACTLAEHWVARRKRRKAIGTV